jgi:hypothetical protein
MALKKTEQLGQREKNEKWQDPEQLYRNIG